MYMLVLFSSASPLSHTQVRALVDLLPDLEVVVDDPFNSDPKDPKYMGPDALQRFRSGEQLPTTMMRTPLVRGRWSSM
jgi:magnesium chelatase subunit I